MWEGTLMRIIHGFIAVLMLVLFLTACTMTSAKEKPKVYCPACGAEVDAIFQKRF
jgi:cytochrome b561